MSVRIEKVIHLVQVTIIYYRKSHTSNSARPGKPSPPPKRVCDPYPLRMLAPSALVFFALLLLVFHLSNEARMMGNKQQESKELSQAAKWRERIQKESGGSEHRTVSKTERGETATQ